MSRDPLEEGEVIRGRGPADRDYIYHTEWCWTADRIKHPNRTTEDSLGDHYRECQLCSATGDDNPSDNGGGKNWREMACPRCGDGFKVLPNHLPACDGGDA